MKKVVVITVLILAISAIITGCSHDPPALRELSQTTIASFAELMSASSRATKWAAENLSLRHTQAAYDIQKITDKMEQWLIEAIQYDVSPRDAMWILEAACMYVATQLITDGMRDLDTTKMATATEIMQWAGAKLDMYELERDELP